MSNNWKEICDDFVRGFENAIWESGGCEAVEEFRLDMRTCKKCFHVHEQPFINCEMCRYDHAQAMLDEMRGIT